MLGDLQLQSSCEGLDLASGTVLPRGQVFSSAPVSSQGCAELFGMEMSVLRYNSLIAGTAAVSFVLFLFIFSASLHSFRLWPPCPFPFTSAPVELRWLKGKRLRGAGLAASCTSASPGTGAACPPICHIVSFVL